MADNKPMTKRERQALDNENSGAARRQAAIRARVLQAEIRRRGEQGKQRRVT